MVGWGHLCLPFCAAAKWRCVSVLPRTCGGGELGRVMPSWSEVGGSPIRSEQAAKNPADARLDAAGRRKPENYVQNTRAG